MSFATTQNQPVRFQQGNAGQISFTETTGVRVWTAWGVSAIPVHITGRLSPGDTQVCGTSAPGPLPVQVRDVTTEGADVVIGTGTTDASGAFCVAVSTLVKNQVVIAQVEGTICQPAIVGGVNRILVPVGQRA